MEILIIPMSLIESVTNVRLAAIIAKIQRYVRAVKVGSTYFDKIIPAINTNVLRVILFTITNVNYVLLLFTAKVVQTLQVATLAKMDISITKKIVY